MRRRMASKRYILAGDIGGTNANFALISEGNKILHKKRYSTQTNTDFIALVNEYLTAIKACPKEACFAVAGPVASNRGKLTHADVWVDAKKILRKTPFKKCLVINDFDAVSFAIDNLKPTDATELKKGRACSKEDRIVIIGAGTGLGKSLLVWDEHCRAHVPVPSGIGHGDIVIHTKEELNFLEFTKKRLGIKAPASWEIALSGQGLENIYQFLKCTKFNNHAGLGGSLSAYLISKNRKRDPVCRETFLWFERFYARLAKNAVLDAVAMGGVYLAGGIVAKNPDMFTDAFRKEFINNLLLKDILENAPVRAIINYDISLIGCANAMRVWKGKAECKK